MPFTLAALVATLIAPASTFFLHDGDRVVFYGDSITEGGAYERYVENFVLTRFPKLDVRFINSGWAGDKVTGGSGGTVDQRIDRDVIAQHPTVVTIMLGMNDGGMQPISDKSDAAFKSGYSHIIDRIRLALPDVRLVLMKPSPFDDVNFPPTFPGGYNATLVKFGQDIEELAKAAHAMCVDCNGPMVEMLQKAKDYDADVAKRLIPDRIHPEPAGHLVMAEELLRAWDAPSRISYVDFDYERQRMVERDGAFVREMRFERGMSWTQDDDCLPFPLEFKNPRVALVVRSSGAMLDLNKQGIKVRHLPAPEYRLLIDDQEVGVFSKQQLTDGIEISTYDTPMSRQAWQLVELTYQRAALRFSRWRTVEIGLAQIDVPQRRSAMQVLDTLEDAVIHRQRELATPHPHRYQLVPTT